ncbi:Chimeric ERCC6-PGBD3 protein [Cucumispora dikerogammari]|nr:Chimeric ERCC6-PGBD3 protein [Cucumispora dikerogammari]
MSTFHNEDQDCLKEEVNVPFSASSNNFFSHILSENYTENDVTETKPNCILDYNKYVRGVDLSDQLIKNYTIQGQNRRWMYKMTLFVFQCCINNAYITYVNLMGMKINQFYFRKQVFYYLINQ